MSIRRLRTLIAVAEKGSFAAAADAVFVSQAAVSQQMKALENALELRLFDRSGRTPRLNPTGLAIIPRAREILRAYDALSVGLEADGGLMGELTIGALPTTLAGLVPRALAVMKERYERLHVRVVPGLSADLQPQVDRGVLDAAILSQPPYEPAHLHWQPFAEEPLVVVASERDPLDEPEALLRARPYIRFSRRAWVGQLIEEWLQRRRLQVRESMELDTLEAIANMVYQGLGVSIVPSPCVPPPRPLPLKRLALPGARPRVLGVLSRRDGARLPLVNAFLAELTALVADPIRPSPGQTLKKNLS